MWKSFEENGHSLNEYLCLEIDRTAYEHSLKKRCLLNFIPCLKTSESLLKLSRGTRTLEIVNTYFTM